MNLIILVDEVLEFLSITYCPGSYSHYLFPCVLDSVAFTVFEELFLGHLETQNKGDSLRKGLVFASARDLLGYH